MEQLVSVIIPNYNGEAFIEECIASVQAQTYQNLEIIIVDDGSSDRSRSIINSLLADDSRIIPVFQNNTGVAEARNNGIAVANGFYIAFLDSDDYWHPEKIKYQVTLLNGQPDSKVCYSGFTKWYPDKKDRYPAASTFYPIENENITPEIDPVLSSKIYPKLFEDVYIWTGTVLMEKSVLDDVGAFKNDLVIGEDYDLWLRIAYKYKILKLIFPFALYRIRSNSLTTKIHEENYQAQVLERIKEKQGLSDIFGNALSEQDFRAIMYGYWFSYGYQCYWAGRIDLAAPAFQRASSYQRTIKTFVYQVLSNKFGFLILKSIENIFKRTSHEP